MGRFEGIAAETVALGVVSEGPDTFFRLGMMYATGSSVPADYVTAHKWFNLAAMGGLRDAIRLRREIAEMMSEAEIATAQRAARDWLGR